MVRRIETGKAMLIYGTAGFIDLTQAVLALFTGGIAGFFQTVFGIVGYAIIWLMFATSGVSFFPTKKVSGALNKVTDATGKASKNSLFVFLILMGLELLPELGSFIPSITINAIMTVKSSQEEDEAKNKEVGGTNLNTIRTKRDSSSGGITSKNTSPKTSGAIRNIRPPKVS